MIRKLHRFAVWIAGIPTFFIFCTGLLLQVKNWIPWVQPPIQMSRLGKMGIAGSMSDPSLDLNSLLKISSSVPAAKVQSWKDIRAIDIRPSNGVARVRTRSEYEISIDLGTGQVLQAAPRRTSLLIELHEGSFFGEKIKYAVFLPTAIFLLVLWVTGIILLIRPWRGRMRQLTRVSLKWRSG